MQAPDGAPPPRAATPAPRAESRRYAFRSLARAFAVVPGEPTACPICGELYLPAGEMYVVCSACYTRLRRTLTHRDVLLGVAVKALAGTVTARTSPADTDA